MNMNVLTLYIMYIICLPLRVISPDSCPPTFKMAATPLATYMNMDPFADLVQAVRQSLLPPTPSPLVTASAGTMARPATYTGEVEDCNGFLLQCSLYFEMQPSLFTTDRSRVATLKLPTPYLNLSATSRKCLGRLYQASPYTINSSIFVKVQTLSVHTPFNSAP